VSGAVSAPEWTRRPERGSLPLYRFIVWFSRTLGRAPARLLLRVVAVYFLLFGGRAGRASRDYLARCLGRRPTLAERYGHFFTFASVLHDRIFFLLGRLDLFDLRVEGAEHLGNGGAILMGAHVGSFEALRAAGHALGGRRVAMAMFPDNAPKANAVYSAIDPRLAGDIVPLGRVDAMLEIESRLEAGALVGFLADRSLEGDSQGTLEVAFLGSPARFPLGPMRMAAVLRQRVFFMCALHRGGNRYDVVFEPIADFSKEASPRAEREARVREAVARYAAVLERQCRAAPGNWFNFFPFWP
jgi:predicted LPLAT superfamily acyltransferase